jgi:hypothetical protein
MLELLFLLWNLGRNPNIARFALANNPVVDFTVLRIIALILADDFHFLFAIWAFHNIHYIEFSGCRTWNRTKIFAFRERRPTFRRSGNISRCP